MGIIKAPNVRGMLLEEVVLFLLRKSGYKTIEGLSGDPTIGNSSAGLTIRGRGERHQIDAIADYVFTPPYSYPLRLLIEAKCLHQKVGIDITRNALGVLKDVSEFWYSERGIVEQKKYRYHYQYAVFSASEFTSFAMNYGFAQDINLVYLGNTRFFDKIINSIYSINEDILYDSPSTIMLNDLRIKFRHYLRNHSSSSLKNRYENYWPFIRAIKEQAREINSAFLALINNRFPVFLIKNPMIETTEIENGLWVRLYYSGNDWVISDERERILFSFNLPAELLDLYAENGRLDPFQAVLMKGEQFSRINILIDDRNEFNGVPRFVQLRLDERWYESILNNRRNIG